MTKNITHEGVVTAIDGDRVTVRFVQHSACSECRARALCSSGTSESAERRIVARRYGVAYEVGDVVRVVVGSGLAWSAVVIAFVIPLVLALAALAILVNVLQYAEVVGCLAVLAMLAVYYLVVWLMRHRLERRVEFTLERLY